MQDCATLCESVAANIECLPRTDLGVCRSSSAFCDWNSRVRKWSWPLQEIVRHYSSTATAWPEMTQRLYNRHIHAVLYMQTFKVTQNTCKNSVALELWDQKSHAISTLNYHDVFFFFRSSS